MDRRQFLSISWVAAVAMIAAPACHPRPVREPRQPRTYTGRIGARASRPGMLVAGSR